MMIPPISMPPAATPPTPPTSAGIGPDPGAVLGGSGSGGVSFGQELSRAIDQMQNLQTDATQQVGNLVQGGSTDVHAGMIAVEKADLAFGLMLQLRNKAVEAYQDISHMAF